MTSPAPDDLPPELKFRTFMDKSGRIAIPSKTRRAMEWDPEQMAFQGYVDPDTKIIILQPYDLPNLPMPKLNFNSDE